MPNDIKKLKRLMSAANYLKKSKPVILRGASLDPSNALKYAWWFESFRAKLSSGIYRFSYFKIDGSIREAVGTLDMTRIPEKDHPKGDMSDGAERKPNTDTFCYYDLNVNGWRSFRIDLFIGFITKV